jgi:hypothetical protein
VTIYVALATTLVGLVYFALTATGLGLLLSPAVGLIAFVFFRLVDPEERGRTGFARVLIAAGVGSGTAGLLSILLNVSHSPQWDSVGVLSAIIFAAATYSLWARGSAAPCVLCKLPPQSGAVISCPRCGDSICMRPTCWNARYARCTRCHEREVVIFPIADKWWDRRLGHRVMKGECTSCYKEAHETDLRECGRCHWPMCRRCWDYYNGACKRCEWTIPDLPATLTPFVKKTKQPARPAGRPVRPGAPARPPQPSAGGSTGPDSDDTRAMPAPNRSIRPGRH